MIHAANRGVYGAPRIYAELRLVRGIRVGRKRVERLMSSAQINGLVPRKRGKTTIRVPGVRVVDDLVDRQFHPAGTDVALSSSTCAAWPPQIEGSVARLVISSPTGETARSG